MQMEVLRNVHLNIKDVWKCFPLKKQLLKKNHQVFCIIQVIIGSKFECRWYELFYQHVSMLSTLSIHTVEPAAAFK